MSCPSLLRTLELLGFLLKKSQKDKGLILGYLHQVSFRFHQGGTLSTM